MTIFSVLDHGFVELTGSMGSDLTVVNSARISFAKRKSKITESDIKLINYLIKNEHYSPLRHVQFQFHIKMPEFLARQTFKHQVGCAYTSGNQAFESTVWNELSGRYVDMSEVDYYHPSDWYSQAEDNKQASGEKLGHLQAMCCDMDYLRAIRVIQEQYKALINDGVSREQARMILPLSFYTEFYWTASLQAVCHFIKLRNHPGAQIEIREYAKAIQQLIEPICPHSVKALLDNSN